MLYPFWRRNPYIVPLLCTRSVKKIFMLYCASFCLEELCAVYFKFAQWVELAVGKREIQSGVPGPGPVWRCQGQLGVPGPVWECQGQSGVPGPVRMCQGHWGARANLACQGQSGVPGPLRACQSKSEVPTPIWGAGVNLECQCKSRVPGDV